MTKSIKTKPKRCKVCNKKIKLSDIVANTCPCNNLFCILHNPPWVHSCKVLTSEIIKRKYKDQLRVKLVKTNIKIYNKL